MHKYTYSCNFWILIQELENFLNEMQAVLWLEHLFGKEWSGDCPCVFMSWLAGDIKLSVFSDSDFEKCEGTRARCAVDWYILHWCRNNLIRAYNLHVPPYSINFTLFQLQMLVLYLLGYFSFMFLLSAVIILIWISLSWLHWLTK